MLINSALSESEGGIWGLILGVEKYNNWVREERFKKGKAGDKEK